MRWAIVIHLSCDQVMVHFVICAYALNGRQLFIWLAVVNHLFRDNRRPQSRGSFQDRQETSKNSKQDEDEDNWELPDGDLPY